MRGNKLAGEAPALRFPPTPRLLPFHLTFFFSPPPRQQQQEVIIHLNANLTLPLTFSGPLRGAEAGEPRSPLPAKPSRLPVAGGAASPQGGTVVADGFLVSGIGSRSCEATY